MKREQILYSFQLNDDPVFDEKVDSITCIELNVLVDHGKPDLVFKMQTIDSELIVQAGLIGAFQEPRAKGRVNFHRGIDDSTGDVFVQHRVLTSVSAVSSVVESVDRQTMSRS